MVQTKQVQTITVVPNLLTLRRKLITNQIRYQRNVCRLIGNSTLFLHTIKRLPVVKKPSGTDTKKTSAGRGRSASTGSRPGRHRHDLDLQDHIILMIWSWSSRSYFWMIGSWSSRSPKGGDLAHLCLHIPKVAVASLPLNSAVKSNDEKTWESDFVS